jgi:Flagellar protein YcgR/PilZ domain
MTDIALNLAVGSQLELEFLSDDNLKNLHSELIGYAQDQSIILTHPKKDNIPVQVNLGDRFIVSLKQGDANATFETEVVAVLNSPYPHVHATYPENIRSGSLRKSNRIPAHPANVRLSMENNNEVTPISIFDISCAGACLVADRRLGMMDDQFQIEIQAGTGQAHTSVGCMIRYIREVIEDSHSRFHHGVVFIGMDAEAQLFLWKFVQESVSMQRQPTETLS